MKKIVIVVVLVLVLLGSSVEASFESWKQNIEEVIEEVDSKYRIRIQIAADEHPNIDEIDLWAKIVVESNGDSDAVSETSVKGLTMLTLNVVDLIRRETGVVIDRLHPYEAIWGAGWYLSHLIETYGFTTQEAHGAYFYGPNGLKDQLKNNDIEDLYHVKKINYVKEIIRSKHQ